MRQQANEAMSWRGWLIVSTLVLLLSAACMLWVDLPVAEYMQGLDAKTRALAEPVTALGKAEWPLVAVVLLAAVFAVRRQWSRANASALVFFAIVLTLVVHPLKIVFGRARPKLTFAEESVYGFFPFKLFEEGGSYYDYASYPSGHSATAGALAVSVWLVAPNWLRWPVVLLSVLIALSRVVLTSHWVGDTLTGYLLGAVCAAVVHWRFTRRGWLTEPRGLLKAKRVDE